MKVELAEQVVEFVRRLPPDPRRRLRRALRDLAAERRSIVYELLIEALESRLTRK